MTLDIFDKLNRDQELEAVEVGLEKQRYLLALG
jgi:hypothetical protein